MDMELILLAVFVFIATISAAGSVAGSSQCTVPPVCHCEKDQNKIIAQCSRAGLEYIPDLTWNVTHIYLNNNPISTIGSYVFPETTVYLNLSWCEIKVIEVGAFRFLPHLVVLDLFYNREMTYLALPNVTSDLRFTSIRSLNLSAIHCMWGDGTIVRLSHLEMLQNTSVEEMDLASNRISHFEAGVLSSLPTTLERVNLADNALQAGWYMYELFSLPNLTCIDLSNLFKNDHSYLPIFRIPCNDTKAIPCNMTDKPDVKGKGYCDRTCERKRLSRRTRSLLNFFHKVFTLIVYMPKNLNLFESKIRQFMIKVLMPT